MLETLYRCGFDRVKLSLSNFSLKPSALDTFEFQNLSYGYYWYSNSRLRIGLERCGKYAVIELYALFFIELKCDLTEIYNNILFEIDKYFVNNGEIKFSRIDLYCDYKSYSGVTALIPSDYARNSSVKVGEWRGSDNTLETSYLFPQGKSWLLRRYNKSLEIVQNDHSHRYDDFYDSDVIRCEFEYSSCLKNLKKRDFDSCLSYIINHLQHFNIPEASVLFDVLSPLSFLPHEYKSCEGENNNVVKKRNIIKHLLILIDDYKSLGGDVMDMIGSISDHIA